ncbi:MAG: hypothetical protein GX422_06140 [Deltaproteobacteria bacterium]|nr:hypothetical protein [Deltaproteobacteria bacterium]
MFFKTESSRLLASYDGPAAEPYAHYDAFFESQPQGFAYSLRTGTSRPGELDLRRWRPFSVEPEDLWRKCAVWYPL